MPKPYPQEFREDVVWVARNREPGVTLEQVAANFGVHPASLTKWLRHAETENSATTRPATAPAELREARKRIRMHAVRHSPWAVGAAYGRIRRLRKDGLCSVTLTTGATHRSQGQRHRSTSATDHAEPPATA